METKVKTSRITQLIYIHYETPKPDGHLITVNDSWRNKLGQIHEKYDEQTGKFEYTFCDHQGEEVYKKESLEELKEEIARHKAIMFEEAHQRRIQQKQEKGISPYSPSKKKENKEKTVPVQQTHSESKGKTVLEKAVNESQDVLKTVHEYVGGEEDREAELREIRKRKRNRGQELSR